MLEETGRVEMATTSPDGSLSLVITDSSFMFDQGKRYVLFRKKLDTYAAYVESADFVKNHPGVPLDKVQILVVCRTPPTLSMQQIKDVQTPGPKSARIPVVFDVFPG